MRLVALSLIALAFSFHLPAARADEEIPRRQLPRRYVIAFELGLLRPPDHLIYAGTDGGVWHPPEYAGVVVDGRVLPHLHLDGQFGLNFVVGWMASFSARLAAEVSRVTVSIGAGPLIASGTGAEGRPAATYADTDVSAIIHFDGPFVLLFRAGAAWALGDRGGPMCGVDTCTPYLARGDRITFVRLGIGGSF